MTPRQSFTSLYRKKFRRWVVAIMGVAMAVIFLHPLLLEWLGSFLVVDAPLVPADAAVVLSTGMEYYPRLSEAARLYREGLVREVVINGNRKTAALRNLERAGFSPCCPWYEDSLRILGIYDVPRERIVAVDAPDAYDTVSESRAVGASLAGSDITRVIITTSKSHTRRALYIWRALFGDRFDIQVAAAREDPFDPAGWWRHGRQIRWVMAEVGAWPYGWWKLRDHP